MTVKRKVKVNLSVADAKADQANDAGKEPVEKVCDRARASLCEKLTYGYAGRMYQLHTQGAPISLENYPEVADEASMKANADRLEAIMQEYIEKDPNDRQAVMKAVFQANKWEYIMFVAVRLVNKVSEILQGLLFLEIVRSFEQQVGPFTLDQYWHPICLGVAKVSLDLLQMVWWGFFDFNMVMVGHLTQASLKTILFRKNFRMSEATNKDFSSGEINSIIMGETGRVWQFVWSMSDYFEVPLEIALGVYYIYNSVGIYAITATICNIGFMYYHKKKGDQDEEKRKKMRQLADQRNTYTVESLSNIKTLKLYGWEQKFRNKIEGLYQENLKL